MRICAIVDQVNPVLEAALRLLVERAVSIDLLRPEAQVLDLGALRVEHDLYLLKSRTELGLSLAGALHAAGAATLNPYPAVALLRNKIIAIHRLQAAGLPTPASYVTTNPRDLVPLLEGGPLILKPSRGSRGQGIRIVQNPGELQDHPSHAPIVAQRYHEPEGRDYKVFCIGGEFFGVPRRWPIRSYADKVGEPFAVTAELSELGLRCGRLSGSSCSGWTWC